MKSTWWKERREKEEKGEGPKEEEKDEGEEDDEQSSWLVCCSGRGALFPFQFLSFFFFWFCMLNSGMGAKVPIGQE